MKKFRILLIGLLSCALLSFIACNNDPDPAPDNGTETTGGETTGGETTGGETTGGETTGGGEETVVTYTVTAMYDSLTETTTTSEDAGWDASAINATFGTVTKQGSKYCFSALDSDYYTASECAMFGYTISDDTGTSFKVTNVSGSTTYTFTAS